MEAVSAQSDDGSDTDLDTGIAFEKLVQQEQQQQQQSTGLTRSQTVYVTSCQQDRLTQQARIVSGLSKSCLSVKNRYLGSNSFRPVSLALRVNDQVTKLDFSYNGMDAEGMLHLCNMLKVNTAVQELMLASNNLGDKGAIALADMMKHNSTIHTMDISDNKFGEEGGKFLALGIEENGSIKHLNISRNGFSETGALYIGRALAENFVVENFNISWCRVRKVGAVGLCQGIRRNVSLATVDMSWNGFGYEGSLALAEMLRANKYLRELSITNCRINWQGAAMLADALKVNFNLEILHIGDNPLSTTGCMDLLEGVAGADSAVTLLDLKGNRVTPDFDFLAQTIRTGRNLNCQHDGILPSHDLLGQHRDKRKDPMSQVIEYMEKYQLRPLELFRSFDKDVALRMGKTDFITRLQKIGINLSESEVDDVVYQLKKGGDGKNKKDKLKGDINFKKFSEGFRDQRRKERIMKIQEANLQHKLQTYHQDILSEGVGTQRVSEELGQLSLTAAFFDSEKLPAVARQPSVDASRQQQPQPALQPLAKFPHHQRKGKAAKKRKKRKK